MRKEEEVQAGTDTSQNVHSNQDYHAKVNNNQDLLRNLLKIKKIIKTIKIIKLGSARLRCSETNLKNAAADPQLINSPKEYAL